MHGRKKWVNIKYFFLQNLTSPAFEAFKDSAEKKVDELVNIILLKFIFLEEIYCMLFFVTVRSQQVHPHRRIRRGDGHRNKTGKK